MAMRRWVCLQKTFCDLTGDGRSQIFKPGDEISIPEEIIPPSHVWSPIETYIPPDPPQSKEERKSTTYGPSLPPVDKIRMTRKKRK